MWIHGVGTRPLVQGDSVPHRVEGMPDCGGVDTVPGDRIVICCGSCPCVFVRRISRKLRSGRCTCRKQYER